MSDTDGWGFREGDEIVPGVLAIKRLGGGRKYEVYLSWDERLYSLVATKLVRPEQVTESKALGQIENEAEVLRRVSHPVVVRLFYADLEGPRPHLVLEHLKGPTLRSLLRRYGPLSNGDGGGQDGGGAGTVPTTSVGGTQAATSVLGVKLTAAAPSGVLPQTGGDIAGALAAAGMFLTLGGLARRRSRIK